MVKLSEISQVSKEDRTKTGQFTSGRMLVIWAVAKGYGYTSLKEFWAFAEGQAWDFYDVLKIASP